MITVQMTFIDELCRHKEDVITSWELWRDAQFASDAHKHLVDEAFNEYIRTLDKLLETLVPY